MKTVTILRKIEFYNTPFRNWKIFTSVYWSSRVIENLKLAFYNNLLYWLLQVEYNFIIVGKASE